jgi:hypothetical protein
MPSLPGMTPTRIGGINVIEDVMRKVQIFYALARESAVRGWPRWVGNGLRPEFEAQPLHTQQQTTPNPLEC